MTKKIFEGVKVVDFGWSIVGPGVATYLAELGATVIRIESTTRPDILRDMGPFVDFKPGRNRSQLFNFHNVNKYSLALDLKHPKGYETVKQLLEWADVMTVAFTTGVTESWGLGYDDVTKFNPGIIYYGTNSVGNTGPWRHQTGHGQMVTTLVGMNSLTGWPDRESLPPGPAYSDVACVHLIIPVIVAALLRKHRTGKGMYLDYSQYEGLTQFIAPLLLDARVNGHEFVRRGNRDSDAVPHATFQCKGRDKWCAIAVSGDTQWRTFCTVVGHPEWIDDDRFTTLADRKANEDELEHLIESWTIEHTADEVMTLLQGQGISAGAVWNAEEAWTDPQLQHRKAYVPVNHAELGETSAHCISGEHILSKTPSEVTMAAPCLGEHTEWVCKKILGMPDSTFIELRDANVFN
jgi:crotonobetainyl-CoA:carnitine CoA-transferase CaiB-like acyl-CoA transferase